MTQPDVSVVVPTYREADNLAELTGRLHKALDGAGLRGQIIIVDDNSDDDTQAVCARLARTHPVQLEVRRHERGLSTAVVHGMRLAQGQVIVVMDADLSHPPEKVPELVAACRRDDVDMVIGSRYVSGGQTDEQWGMLRWLNSKVATLMARPFTRAKDPMAGFFAMRRNTFEQADELDPVGYKIGLELMIKCRCRRIAEVPIHFAQRAHGQSKMTLKQQLQYVQHLGKLFWYEWVSPKPTSAAPTWARLAGLLLIAAFYLAIPNARPDFARTNAYDSESYLALAYSLAHGQGYTRSLDPEHYIPHTTWPPGLPALMVPAMMLNDLPISWAAAKWTMCIVAMVGVIFTWWLVKRTTGYAHAADLAALAVACSAVYWDFGHQAMAEVPLYVALVGSLLMIDLLFAGRAPRWWTMLLGGAVAGLGMLIKGHAGALIFAPLAYLVGDRKSTHSRKRHLACCALFVVGFMLPSLAWNVRNHGIDATGGDGINQIRMIRAVHPIDPESRLMTPAESVEKVIENTTRHAIYHLPQFVLPGLWHPRAFLWEGSGYIALPLTLVLVLLCLAWRSATLASLLVIAAITALNVSYSWGHSSRFYVACNMLVLVLLVARWAPKLGQVRWLKVNLVAPAIIAVMSLNLIAFAAWHERYPFASQEWRELAELIEICADMDELDEARVWMRNPHAFTLGSGVLAPMVVPGSYFTHAVIRTDRPRPAHTEGRTILEHGVYLLVELDQPATFEVLGEP